MRDTQLTTSFHRIFRPLHCSVLVGLHCYNTKKWHLWTTFVCAVQPHPLLQSLQAPHPWQTQSRPKLSFPRRRPWNGPLGWLLGSTVVLPPPPSSASTGGAMMKTLWPLMTICGTKSLWVASKSWFKILRLHPLLQRSELWLTLFSHSPSVHLGWVVFKFWCLFLLETWIDVCFLNSDVCF